MSLTLWIIIGIVAVIVLSSVVLAIVHHIGAKRFDEQWNKMTPDEQRQWQYNHAGDSTRHS